MDTNKVFGIVNIGNTCFMNSVLQVLFNIKPLTDALLKIESSHPVIQQYQKILNYWKNNTTNKVVKLQNFCQALYEHTHFNQHQQQDAHEFIYTILDIIHENIKYPVIINTTHDPTDKTIKCKEEWINFCQKNFSVIIPTFYGQIRNTKKCQNCSNESLTREQICGITLDAHAQSMTNALDQYFMNNIIVDYKCEKCNEVQNVVQQKVFEILPEYMIVQLNRFEGINHKNHDIFGFSSIMNLNDYVEPEFRDPKIKYELCGIICHYGSMYSGHYNVIFKHADNTWYYADDEIVRKMTNVISQNVIRNAYLLIYQKVVSDF